jgi:excisionase family DNA binding protein
MSRTKPKDQRHGVPVLMSLPDAADRLSMSTRTLRRKIASGELPAYHVGTQVRVRVDDVVALIKEWDGGDVR